MSHCCWDCKKDHFTFAQLQMVLIGEGDDRAILLYCQPCFMRVFGHEFTY